MRKLFSSLSIIILLISCSNQSTSKIFVGSPGELIAAIEHAKPGDVITLKNGTWTDVQIMFEAEGTAQAPVILKAETAGQVFIEGQSDLSLAGNYLIVDGLYFRNGYTPSNAVIDFRSEDGRIANHSTVRNCVIEGYTQKNRFTADHWVEFWGRHNTLEFCSISGKANRGPTVRVFLKGNENIRTYHSIANNYFGPRPRKGGPRAETMQIGNSGTSMTPSYVMVKNNLFDRCNGEVEVISSKSNFNEFRNNVFNNCEGSLVTRHGNYCIIDGNYFIGDKDSNFNGGVRVINAGHWVTNNYFYQIKGIEFRSPLAIMNGIPKSPLNRYNQVTDVVVAYNTWVDCKATWQLGVGANMDQKDVLPKSEIRSARPIRTILANNIIYNHKPDPTPIQAYDKVDGITFRSNFLSNAGGPGTDYKGISVIDLEMKPLSDWLFVPVGGQDEKLQETYAGFEFEKIAEDIWGNSRKDGDHVGAVLPGSTPGMTEVNADNYGAAWYKPIPPPPGETHEFDPGAGTLAELIGVAGSGDTIILPATKIQVTESILVDKRVTIRGISPEQSVIVYEASEDAPLFRMQPRGELRIEHATIQGYGDQNAFETKEIDMSPPYKLWLDDVELTGFLHIVLGHKGSFADSLVITNSHLYDCSNGIVLAAETDDRGDYNAEFLMISDSEFETIDANVLNFYRGGYDESTIGGVLSVSGSKFTRCGKDEGSNILLKTRGIINVDLRDNEFLNNPVQRVAVLWGAKNNIESGNLVNNSGSIETVQQLKLTLMY